jgi:hypothetical protein
MICTYPKFFLGAYAFVLTIMHNSCMNGLDVHTQIYGGQVFLEPPDHSTFNGGWGGGGGGGPESEIMYACIWIAQILAPRYTIYIGFQTPPIHSAFNGGGGPECVLKITHRSVAKRKVRRSMAHDVFQTPPTDIPLTVGGGGVGLEWNFTLAGPLSIRGMNPLVPNTTSYYYLTCLVTS